MFTVKRVVAKTYFEEIVEARTVVVTQSEDGFRTKELTLIGSPSAVDGNPWIIDTGTVYVMNEQGKTVAKYYISD